MIGAVSNRHALLAVTFRLPDKPTLSIEFVIDTGFTGELTLPPAAVASLGLPYSHGDVVRLADNSPLKVPVHSAVLLWNGQPREVSVLATGRRPLLGTALLDDHDLYVRFREGGPLTVTAIDDAV